MVSSLLRIYGACPHCKILQTPQHSHGKIAHPLMGFTFADFFLLTSLEDESFYIKAIYKSVTLLCESYIIALERLD